MSLITWNFESEYLNIEQQISIIMPDKKRGTDCNEFYRSGKKYKVLWLLHGTYGDHTDWIRKTNIELYAEEKGIVVVMPSAMNSNYSNWPKAMMGYHMYDYFTKELMPLIYGWLPVSDKREDNFIAGLSMGGRGTIKFAVNHPELFCAAAVLSAVPMNFDDFRVGHACIMMDPTNERVADSIENAGGWDAYCNSEENVWRIIDEKAKTGELPKLMFALGHNDAMLYDRYLIFQEHCREIGLAVHWFDKPGYAHEWRFWDLSIQEALNHFFDLEETDSGNPF